MHDNLLITQTVPGQYTWAVFDWAHDLLYVGTARNQADALERARRFMKKNQNAVFGHDPGTLYVGA